MAAPVNHNDIAERLGKLPGQPVIGIAHGRSGVDGFGSDQHIMPSEADARYANAILHMGDLLESYQQSYEEICSEYTEGHRKRAARAAEALWDELLHGSSVARDIHFALLGKEAPHIAPAVA